MTAAMARLQLFGGASVNRTKPKEGLDLSECDRGAIAQALQEESAKAVVDRWLADSSFRLFAWLDSLPYERPADGPGLMAGDCALVKIWTSADPISEEETDQAVLLSMFGAVTGGPGDLLIVTPLSLIYQALSGKEVGDIVTWQSGEGEESATILAMLWLPEKIKEYQEISASEEV